MQSIHGPVIIEWSMFYGVWQPIYPKYLVTLVEGEEREGEVLTGFDRKQREGDKVAIWGARKFSQRFSPLSSRKPLYRPVHGVESHSGVI